MAYKIGSGSVEDLFNAIRQGDVEGFNLGSPDNSVALPGQTSPVTSPVASPPAAPISQSPPIDSNIFNEFGKGVVSGVAGIGKMLPAAAGWAGNILGIKPVEDWSKNLLQQIGTFQQDFAPSVPSYKNVEGLGSGAEYVANILGNLLPSTATSLAGRGAGILAGRMLTPAGAAPELAKQYATWGGRAGAFTGATGLEAGEIAGEQAQTGSLDPLRGVPTSLAAGALEFLPMEALLQRTGLGASLVRKLMGDVEPRFIGGRAPGFAGMGREFLKEGAKQAPLEAITEAGQTGFERFGANQDLFTQAAFEDYLNAAIAGGIGGAALGGAGGALTPVGTAVPEAQKRLRDALMGMMPQPSPGFPPGPFQPGSGASPVGSTIYGEQALNNQAQIQAIEADQNASQPQVPQFPLTVHGIQPIDVLRPGPNVPDANQNLIGGLQRLMPGVLPNDIAPQAPPGPGRPPFDPGTGAMAPGSIVYGDMANANQPLVDQAFPLAERNQLIIDKATDIITSSRSGAGAFNRPTDLTNPRPTGGSTPEAPRKDIDLAIELANGLKTSTTLNAYVDEATGHMMVDDHDGSLGEIMGGQGVFYNASKKAWSVPPSKAADVSEILKVARPIPIEDLASESLQGAAEGVLGRKLEWGEKAPSAPRGRKGKGQEVAGPAPQMGFDFDAQAQEAPAQAQEPKQAPPATPSSDDILNGRMALKKGQTEPRAGITMLGTARTKILGAGDKDKYGMPISERPYSREIRTRMDAGMADSFVDADPAAGESRAQVRKLATYHPENNATSTPVRVVMSATEGWRTAGRKPHAIRLDNHYDSNKDPEKFWEKAAAIQEANPFAHQRNVFANLVRRAGFSGYVSNAEPTGQERWAFTFTPVSGKPPLETAKMGASPVVTGVTKVPKKIKDILGISEKNVEKFNSRLRKVTDQYPEATTAETHPTAFKGRKTWGDEYGAVMNFTNTNQETLRSIASEVGSSFDQDAVLIATPANTKAGAKANATNISFPVSEADLDDFSDYMESNDIPYNIVKKPEGYFAEYVVMDDESDIQSDYVKVIKEFATGEVKQEKYFAEMIKRGTYETNVKNYLGDSEGAARVSATQETGQKHRKRGGKFAIRSLQDYLRSPSFTEEEQEVAEQNLKDAESQGMRFDGLMMGMQQFTSMTTNDTLTLYPGETLAQGTERQFGGRAAVKGPVSVEEALSMAEEAAEKRLAVPTARVQEIADAINKKLPAGVSIKAIRSPYELPSSARERLAGLGPFSTVHGYVDNDGTIYIVSSAMKAEDNVYEIIAHELVGHYGVASLLNSQKKYADTLYQIFQSLWNETDTRTELYELNKLYNFDLANVGDRMQLADEFIAMRAETADMPTWFQKVVALVRDFLRDMGINVGWSDNDIRVLLKRSADYVFAQGESQREAAYAIKAFHGSASRFNKFDEAKIGAGEGSRSFGWGLYFTDKESIGDYYAEKLGKHTSKKKGYTYSVTLHAGKDPSEYQYLDFNAKPDKATIDKVIGALTPEQAQYVTESWGQMAAEAKTNGGLYRMVASAIHNSTGDMSATKAASKLFLGLGIDGFSYAAGKLQGGSQVYHDSPGTNYVVFDDQNVTINKRRQSYGRFMARATGEEDSFVGEFNGELTGLSPAAPPAELSYSVNGKTLPTLKGLPKDPNVQKLWKGLHAVVRAADGGSKANVDFARAQVEEMLSNRPANVDSAGWTTLQNFYATVMGTTERPNRMTVTAEPVDADEFIPRFALKQEEPTWAQEIIRSKWSDTVSRVKSHKPEIFDAIMRNKPMVVKRGEDLRKVVRDKMEALKAFKPYMLPGERGKTTDEQIRETRAVVKDFTDAVDDFRNHWLDAISQYSWKPGKPTPKVERETGEYMVNGNQLPQFDSQVEDNVFVKNIKNGIRALMRMHWNQAGKDSRLALMRKIEGLIRGGQHKGFGTFNKAQLVPAGKAIEALRTFYADNFGYRLRPKKAQVEPVFMTEEDRAGKFAIKNPDRLPFHESPTGSSTTTPIRSYVDADPADGGNVWVRQGKAAENKGRSLMVQFSTHLINKDVPAGDDKQYYDALYGGTRPGYDRLHDFWEIPQWMGFASKFLPDADVYVIRDMNEAIKFFNEAGYDRLMFSAIDVNSKLIKQVAESYDGQLDVGGYTQPTEFDGVENITWYNSMEEFAGNVGAEYSQGTDYRHFTGVHVIPRLTMSQGCLHKCAFCTVPKTLEQSPEDVIMQQAESFGAVHAGLVYLNDKTFGQAANYKMLPEVRAAIEANNPRFEGFIIQTTATQLNKMDDQWLKDSGIRYVELGVESYNDIILASVNKPHRETHINKAMEKMRAANINVIPNIIIGMPDETADTYQRTLDFLNQNADIISHANIYNLAIYKEAPIAKQINAADANDLDENVRAKSFHKDTKIHDDFAVGVFNYGLKQLNTMKPKRSERTERALMPEKTGTFGVEGRMAMKPTTPPEKTITAYKIFRTKKKQPGKLFTLFQDNQDPVLTDTWIAGEKVFSKTLSDKHPGIHAFMTQNAPHLMRKDGSMPDDRVWVQVELSADNDYSSPDRKKIHEGIPTDGLYYIKPPKGQGDEWVIAHKMRVVKVLPKKEPTQLITKPVREFAKKLQLDVRKGTEEMLAKVDAYDQWPYEIGDRIKNKKNGNVWVLKAKTWNMRKDRPMYRVQSADGNTTTDLYADMLGADSYLHLTGPKGKFAARRIMFSDRPGAEREVIRLTYDLRTKKQDLELAKAYAQKALKEDRSFAEESVAALEKAIQSLKIRLSQAKENAKIGPRQESGSFALRDDMGGQFTRPNDRWYSQPTTFADRLKAAWEKVSGWYKENIKPQLQHFKEINYDDPSQLPVVEQLRQAEEIPRYARELAGRFNQRLLRILRTPEDRDTYEHLVVLRDMLREATTGKVAQRGAANVTEFLNAQGYDNVKQLEDHLAIFEGKKNAAVNDALNHRKIFWDRWRQKAVDAKVLPPKVLENEDYFHHQVDIWKELNERFSGTAPGMHKTKKSFQKGRTGFSGEYNLNYFESETAVLTDMITQVQTAKALDNIRTDDKLNVLPKLIAEANRLNALNAATPGAKETWRTVLRAGNLTDSFGNPINEQTYQFFKPERGHFFKKVMTLTDRSIRAVMKEMENQVAPAPDFQDLKKIAREKAGVAISVGPKMPLEENYMVLRRPVVNAMENFQKQSDPSFLGKMTETLQNQWKRWVLFNPFRVVRYLLNNTTGDADIAFAYRPGIFKHVGQATKELFDWAYHDGANLTNAQKNLLEALNRKGVLGSGVTVKEIPELSDDTLQQLINNPKPHLIKRWFATVHKFNAFRENIMRYAAYKYMQAEVDAGRFDDLNYAASKKSEVDAIPDMADKLSKMSRELIGDYGNISYVGQKLARYVIPFYRWMEINAPRYFHMLHNEVKAGKGFAASARLGAQFAARAGAFASAVMLWNYMFFRDEEEEMRRLGRDQLHLILGRRDDGSVVTMRVQGSFSDTLAWLGAENLLEELRSIYKGRISVMDAAKDAAQAPVKKVLGGAVPIFKTVGEAMVGKTMFPEPFAARPIRDKFQHLMKGAGVDWITDRWVQNKPAPPLFSMQAIAKPFLYVTDTREAAYFHSIKLANDWLKDQGRPRTSAEPTPRSNALYYMRQAQKLGDKEGVAYYRALYTKLGGTPSGIKQSVKHTDPLSVIPLKDRAKFLASLNEENRKTWRLGVKWWQDTFRYAVK